MPSKETYWKNPEYYRRYYNKQHHEKYSKLKKIGHILKVNGCAICGYNKCDAALDFHHSNPEDKVFMINMHSIGIKNNEQLVEELNKCILLCANCHREIHYKV